MASMVLIVDDLKINRVVLARLFRGLGFEVVDVEDGHQCIEVLRARHEDVCCVFMDLVMPDMDGHQTAREVRQMEERLSWARVPIIACTAELTQTNSKNLRSVCLCSGMDDCFGKPVSMAVLADILSRHVPSAEKQQRLARTLSAAAISDCSSERVLESARKRLSRASAEATQTSQRLPLRRLSFEGTLGLPYMPAQPSCFQDLDALALQCL